MITKLIVALDFDNEQSAMRLVEKINPQLCALKVGHELFTLLGTQFVLKLINLGYKIFLDLKFHDIPNTVARACSVAADLGVWMINLHASGGLSMMLAARKALDHYGKEKPILLAVTVLTSMNSLQLGEIGIETSVENQVQKLTQLSFQAGMDGVVCSALEVPMVKELCGDGFLTVTPGIRLVTDPKDDQSRIVTPTDAVKLGSDYLVIGRPITRNKNPESALISILESL